MTESTPPTMLRVGTRLVFWSIIFQIVVTTAGTVVLLRLLGTPTTIDHDAAHRVSLITGGVGLIGLAILASGAWLVTSPASVPWHTAPGPRRVFRAAAASLVALGLVRLLMKAGTSASELVVSQRMDPIEGGVLVLLWLAGLVATVAGCRHGVHLAAGGGDAKLATRFRRAGLVLGIALSAMVPMLFVQSFMMIGSGVDMNAPAVTVPLLVSSFLACMGTVLFVPATIWLLVIVWQLGNVPRRTTTGMAPAAEPT